MSKFKVIHYSSDDRWHITLFIKSGSATLQLTFGERMGRREVEEIAEVFNEQMENVSLHPLFLGRLTRPREWQEDIA